SASRRLPAEDPPGGSGSAAESRAAGQVRYPPQASVEPTCPLWAFSQSQSLISRPLRSGHYDPDAVRSCAQTVALHWQTLMLRIEDRLKLVNASAAFYRTSQQVA
ncbi:unnamed protein product, partial [Tetraodon nigroviridis]